MQILDESPLYSNFINSLKSEYTKRNYAYYLKQYMKFHNFTEYSSLMLTDKEERIKQFVIHLRTKEASKSQFKILFATLKNFYEMNDVENIKWRKLKRYIGEEIPEHEDRCYTHEEIHTLVKNASLKLKAAILLMASSGVRIGAIPTMTICHLEKRGDLYKINVYKGQKGKGQYYTFCTPECARAIDSYLELRKRCGEKITPTSTSPLFRKDFDTDLHEQARNAVHPWSRESIIMALRKLSILNGLLVVDHVNPSGNRKEVKLSHGYRKFFVTTLVNSKISETIISKLTGHTIPNSMGLLQIYPKQTESEKSSTNGRKTK